MAKSKKRDYQNDYVSVTQCLNELRKPALENWFKANTAAYCNEESAKGKLIGTQVHDLIQLYIQKEEVKIETEYDVEVKTLLESFVLFREEHPYYILTASELPMTSEIYKFNGTMDCIASCGDDLSIPFDWKSSRCKNDCLPPIFDEHLWQVSSYAKLYEEVHGKEINKAFVLAIAKDKVAYQLREVSKEEITHYFNEIFLPALKICYGKKRKFNVKEK